MTALSLPFDARPIWLLSLEVIVGFPLTNWLYWPAVLDANVLSPDTDSIIIPMIDGVVLAILIAPFVILLAWTATRRRPPRLVMAAWDVDRPAISGSITLVTLAVILCGAWLISLELSAPPGWHGPLWLAYTLLVMIWMPIIRSTLLSPAPAAGLPCTG